MCFEVYCGASGARYRCAKCRLALYCDRECQVADWKAAPHRVHCPLLRISSSDVDVALDTNSVMSELRRWRQLPREQVSDAMKEYLSASLRTLFRQRGRMWMDRATTVVAILLEPGANTFLRMTMLADVEEFDDRAHKRDVIRQREGLRAEIKEIIHALGFELAAKPTHPDMPLLMDDEMFKQLNPTIRIAK